MKATRMRHGWVHMFITHRPTLTLQLHNFDLFRTCTVVSALLRGSWQDFNWHNASRGQSTIAELLVYAGQAFQRTLNICIVYRILFQHSIWPPVSRGVVCFSRRYCLAVLLADCHCSTLPAQHCARKQISSVAQQTFALFLIAGCSQLTQTVVWEYDQRRGYTSKRGQQFWR